MQVRNVVRLKLFVELCPGAAESSFRRLKSISPADTPSRNRQRRIDHPIPYSGAPIGSPDAPDRSAGVLHATVVFEAIAAITVGRRIKGASVITHDSAGHRDVQTINPLGAERRAATARRGCEKRRALRWVGLKMRRASVGSHVLPIESSLNRALSASIWAVSREVAYPCITSTARSLICHFQMVGSSAVTVTSRRRA
jgi:hypothetical protein